MESITIMINQDYKPLVEEIDAIAEQCQTSRAGIIRSVLCDVFEFTPGRPMNGYNSKALRENK
ncbi:hypothetical protein [Methanosarcina sp.]|uniref:hypothetical protein n=1 Tax=Methanosarcina sp. TaxID=2213 RepID=UPI002C0C8AB6|nr:hypothetical protein [Methanosarcina sp.]HOW14984.1 hypothetical protein [Methanosarcina sp.]